MLTWFGLGSAIVTGGLCLNKYWKSLGYDFRNCSNFYVVNPKERIVIYNSASPLYAQDSFFLCVLHCATGQALDILCHQALKHQRETSAKGQILDMSAVPCSCFF